ncbi:OmpA-like transmembrane domain protein [Halomonas sp. THAF5a]|uniref:outer membrane beta-barrel protein n=1 Tax=Halomonas sp. THAF5a TaxID=2587844 RepID=UPI00126865DF|nr:outer membrane beta-barrel protein [Halomonas sp. THAF5a]QFU01715.1 OmpA-like transmembrane domain protein [Halomonas sp. THAF5a]
MNRHTVLALAWLLIPPSVAFDAEAAEFYLFADGGIAEPDLGTLDRRQQRHVARMTGNDEGAPVSVDDRSAAGVIGVGLLPFRHLALELSYHYLGDYRLESRARIDTASHQLDARTTTDVEVRGWGLSGKLLLPIGEALSATATLGVARLETDITAVTTSRGTVLGESISRRERDTYSVEDTVGILGIGAWYQYGPHVGLRLDYRYLGGFGQGDDGGDSDLDLVTAGLVYVF